jgi:hypothetical protein
MTNDRIKRLADESESELDTALRATVPPTDATRALTHLVSSFDARRRRRETIAIAETAKAAALVPRHEPRA